MAGPNDESRARGDSAGSFLGNSAEDAARFVEHLASLTAGGMPLPSGLRALAAETSSRPLRSSLNATADVLESGSPLDDAMRGTAIRFPPYLRGIVAAGLRAGVLAEVLSRYVRHRDAARETRRRFWISLTYPILLVVAMLVVGGFAAIWVVKPFESVFRDFGIDPPRLTVFVLAVANFLVDFGPTLLINGLIALVLIGLGLRFLCSAADRRRIATAVPVVGSALRYSGLGEFCHMLGSLIEADTPLPEALGLASRAASDPTIVSEGERMRLAIDRGASFAAALREWTECPAGLAEVLIWSESHRNLAESLHLAGEMYEQRSRSQADFSGVLFGTLCLIFVLWVLGLTIVALYLPVINLISRLSG